MQKVVGFFRCSLLLINFLLLQYEAPKVPWSNVSDPLLSRGCSPFRTSGICCHMAYSQPFQRHVSSSKETVSPAVFLAVPFFSILLHFFSLMQLPLCLKYE